MKDKIEYNLEKIKDSQFLTDIWFRIIEYLFIIVSLGYFSFKTKDVYLDIVFKFSFIILLKWFYVNIKHSVNILTDNEELKKRWVIYITGYLLLFIVIFLSFHFINLLILISD